MTNNGDYKLISVIIPAYNRKEKLPACLDSVLKQKYPNFEVIVVDDGSSDGTETLFTAEPEQRVKYFRYERNRGACYARNYGALRANGEILAFQDSDDTWNENKLMRQYLRLLRDGADMCFCGMRRKPVSGKSFYYPVHEFHPEHALEDMLAENRASTQTMLMYKYVWEEIRFDESIRRYQDWDFSIRAAARFKLCYLPEALVYSPVGTDSISRVVSSYEHLLRLYDKHAVLYRKYPKSDAVMNRRLGKRVHSADPSLAAAHFKKSFKLSHSPYDLAYYLTDSFRAAQKR